MFSKIFYLPFFDCMIDTVQQRVEIMCKILSFELCNKQAILLNTKNYISTYENRGFKIMKSVAKNILPWYNENRIFSLNSLVFDKMKFRQRG